MNNKNKKKNKIKKILNVKKTLYLIVFLLANFGITAIKVNANNLPELLRVGLEAKHKNVDSVQIGNEYITVALGGNSGLAEICGSLRSNSGFKMVVDNNSYTQSGGLYTDFNQAMQVAADNGAVVAIIGQSNYALYYQNGQGNSSPARVSLMDGNKTLVTFEASQYYPWIMDGNSVKLEIGNQSYRAAVEFSRRDGGKITPVNVLTIDEYLYSVVSSEMPSGWNIEALKAQAVAAKNYTLTRMGIHKDNGYDMCDVGHCQSYLGAGNEAESVNRAVNETRGLLIYFENLPINATYFSSSGGYTENSENVWTNMIPYLRGVKEIYEYEPKIWTRSFNISDITNLLVKSNKSIGTALSVSIGETGTGGRVAELIINGTQGSISLYKEEIRNFFASSAGGSLESRNFTISNGMQQGSITTVSVLDGYNVSERSIDSLYAVSSSGTVNVAQSITVLGSSTLVSYAQSSAIVSSGGDQIVFSGSGYGHGVGLSQHGAEGMAQRGYNFRQILEHYYTGAIVR